MPGHPSLTWENSGHRGEPLKVASFDSNGKATYTDASAGSSIPLHEGAWNALTTYQINDIVSLSGSSYMCILEHSNHTPPNATYWNLLASKGDTGPAGSTGPAGANGSNGATGATGAAGTNGSVWRDGTGAPSSGLGVNGDYYLDGSTGNVYLKSTGTYSVVANIKGANGATGSTGPAGPGFSDGDKGDIVVSGSATVLTIDSDSVTFSKMQNISTDKLLGRDSSGSGDIEEISVGGGVEFSGSGGIRLSSLGGDVSSSPGSTTIQVNQARGALETSGPTSLSYGSIPDGSFLKRVGSTIIGSFIFVAFATYGFYDSVYILNQSSSILSSIVVSGTIGGP